MTTSITQQPIPTLWRRAARLARRAARIEVGNYGSLYRLVLRRPRVPPGATALTYHKPDLPVLIVITVVSALEIAVVDLIVHRWTVVRVPLLLLGIWGLLFMLGMLAAMLTRPHAVGPEGIRARSGAEIDVALPWDDIYTITRRRKVVQQKEPRVTTDLDSESTLHLRVQNETNIEIRLHQPVSVRLPDGTATIKAVNLYADDPGAFMEAARLY